MSGHFKGTGARPERVVVVVDRFREGDPYVTELVRRKVRRILAFRDYGIPPEDRRDLEQAIITQLWQAVTRPEFKAPGFWGFVEIVTSRRCIDWLRSRRPETSFDAADELPDPRTSPLKGVLREEELGLAHAAFARLPRACRDLIQLQAGQGKSYREIAEILGSTEATLRVQMHRCIKRAQILITEVTKSRK